MTHPQTVDYLGELALIEASRIQREAFSLCVWKPRFERRTVERKEIKCVPPLQPVLPLSA